MDVFSFQATLHSRSDGDGKCTVNSRQSQTSQTDLSVIEEEDVELGAAELQRSTIETQTSQSPSSFVREVPCSHYVVDMSIPRRDYVINYNSNSRHDPPPPYSEWMLNFGLGSGQETSITKKEEFYAKFYGFEKTLASQANAFQWTCCIQQNHSW